MFSPRKYLEQPYVYRSGPYRIDQDIKIFFPLAVTITQVEYKQVNEELVKH